MTSQEQIEANRRNALKSTGPKTPETKAIVSKNAVKHGLCAQHTVIDTESWIEFNEFHNELVRYFNPVGFLEQLLADRFITASWRLRRAVRIEVELFNYLQQPKPTPSTDPCNNDTQEHEPPCNLRIVKTYPTDSSSKHLEEYSADEAKSRLSELKDTLKRACINTCCLRSEYLISKIDVFCRSHLNHQTKPISKALSYTKT
jgi:hypothetical protein